MSQFTLQWIAPQQAMPPLSGNHSHRVIVFDEAYGIAMAYFDYESGHWISRTEDTTTHLDHVIAWCPLPPIPQVVTASDISEANS
jgi:hypothetical protein